jgi:hypothetical protein
LKSCPRKLESKFDGALENSNALVAERRGHLPKVDEASDELDPQAFTAPRSRERRMIQYIKRLEPQIQSQSFMKRRGWADLAVKLEIAWSKEIHNEV